jgi:hypothetical protein
LGILTEQLADQAICRSAGWPTNEQSEPGAPPGHTTGLAPPVLGDWNGRLEALHEGSTVGCLVDAVLEEAAAAGECVKATLLRPDHSETSRTLQRLATRMATKLCRRPWKVKPSRPAR